MFPKWVINQHFRLISEESLDTEDWSNHAAKALHHRNKLNVLYFDQITVALMIIHVFEKHEHFY